MALQSRTGLLAGTRLDTMRCYRPNFMIDFHSHILPNMDDGPESVATSLAMLRHSFLQGVDVMVSTSHFYADEEFPQRFLERRTKAFRTLQEAMLLQAEVYPGIVLGAEVLYFPGISEADELLPLTIGSSRSILIEPPMTEWTDSMLDDIVLMGKKLKCKPVIAHVDRFMTYLQDESLISRVLERNMLVQVNADYFLNPATTKAAMKNLKLGNIHLIGSDCHDLGRRAPNLGAARKLATAYGLDREFRKLHRNALLLLRRKG